MRKYRVGDCIGYTSWDGCLAFTVVETTTDSSKLWGRWFCWDVNRTYLLEKSVEFYIPKEYC